MLRPTLFLAAAMLAMPLYAQAPTPGAAIPGAECLVRINATPQSRSEEHTSELQSLMRISYAVFCLKKKTKKKLIETNYIMKRKPNIKQTLKTHNTYRR